MSGPVPYLQLPGTARDALQFYGDVFGCSVQLHTFEEFHRTDGPSDAVAHGYLSGGRVDLFASDAGEGESALKCEGLMMSLLGTADPDTLTTWFNRLAEGGRVVDPLQSRDWSAHDGQVIDRFGIHWLIGFEGGA
jgi:PhnB protein